MTHAVRNADHVWVCEQPGHDYRVAENTDPDELLDVNLEPRPAPVCRWVDYDDQTKRPVECGRPMVLR